MELGVYMECDEGNKRSSFSDLLITENFFRREERTFTSSLDEMHFN